MTYQYPPPVGNWLPFLVGLPLGGAAGYFLRRWQEANPGQLLPGIPSHKVGEWYDLLESIGCMPPSYGEPIGCEPGVGCEPYTVGGPWVDVGSYISPTQREYIRSLRRPPSGGLASGMRKVLGGSFVGAQTYADPEHARRTSWPQTRLLIHSAIAEVSESASRAPAAAYVWSLDPPGPSPYPGVELTGTTIVVPFSSHGQALDYLRERIQTPHVALALFDRRSPHWPNPVNWSRSNDPAYEPLIAQQIARSQPTARASGYYR